MSQHRLRLTIFSIEERVPGFMSLLAFLLCFIFSQSQYSISCEQRVARHLENCQVTMKSLALWSETHTLNDLYDASVVPYLSHDDKHGLVYDIRLEGNDKTIPLSPIPSIGFAQKQQARDKIKHFIKKSDELALTINNTEPFWFSTLSLLMVIFSLYLTLKPPIIQITADRRRKTLQLVHLHVFGIKRQTIDMDLVKMFDVQYKLTKKGQRRYRLGIVLKNREAIAISEHYSHYFHLKKKVTDKLNRFFGLEPPHHYGKTPTFYTYNPLHILLGLLIIGFIIAIYLEST